ncbi:MAG: NACHT domain-containing protein, partial [Cyanobacteria bacterium J06649_11]
MPVRSLSVSQQFIEQVRDSVAQRGLTQTQLASELGVSRSSVVKFLSGQNVDRRIFVRCCTALEIDWDVISGTNKSQAQNTHDTKATANNSKKLIRDIRNNVKADIHARCSTMRVLDMEQPIGIEDIYTNVNILEKLSGRQRLSLDELLANYDSENFDRFLIGQVRNERVSGVDAVERYNKLIILGKPGAGKTTFMKRLATLCNYGEFQPHCVPVFVTLKEFTEADGHPRLQDYIARQWDLCGVNDAEALVKILNQGCALILLDGLDEVRASDRDRVLRNINAFTNEFRYCRFVITCRIAAQDYIFQQFTEVEIADFTLDQIAEFAIKWFSTKKDPEKSKLFIQQLSENIP